ncbi:MAG: hypothetical protein K2M00_07815 [Muribaculaceae bacterium]|nr:hypothetical protein [Muribaculaceae bacterium]
MKLFCKSLLIAVVAVVALCFNACDNDDVIWDIAPVSLDFIIVDSDGNSLLDPAREDNVLNNDIYIVYQGKEYPIVDFTKDPQPLPLSRAYLASFYGLRALPEAGEDWSPMSKRYLSFGEFDGAANQDITAELVWPEENRRFTVRVEHKYKMKGNKPKITNKRYFDGKRIDASYFTIVK